jgi:hypothetical protein
MLHAALAPFVRLDSFSWCLAHFASSFGREAIRRKGGQLSTHKQYR